MLRTSTVQGFIITVTTDAEKHTFILQNLISLLRNLDFVKKCVF